MASGQADMSGGAGAETTGRKWGRRLVTLLAGLVTLFVFVIVVGALLHTFRIITVIGTIFESFFTLHVFILGLVAIALAQWARSFGTRHVATIIQRSGDSRYHRRGGSVNRAGERGAPLRRADILDGPFARCRARAATETGSRRSFSPRWTARTSISIFISRRVRRRVGRNERSAASHGDEHVHEHEAGRAAFRAGGDDSRRRILARHAQHGNSMGPLVRGAWLHGVRR